MNRPRPAANDPCPCGSASRFVDCHGRRPPDVLVTIEDCSFGGATRSAVAAYGGTAHIVRSRSSGAMVAMQGTSAHVFVEDSVEADAHVRARELYRGGDEHASWDVEVDVDRGSYVHATAQRRPRTEEVEGKALAFLAQSYGAGWRAELSPKGVQFPDGKLVGGPSGAGNIEVEVRVLDGELAKALGIQKEATSSTYHDHLPDVVRAAIGAKGAHYGSSSSSTSSCVLALYCPFPLATLLRDCVEAGRPYDHGGFAEVWICPVGSAAFRL